MKLNKQLHFSSHMGRMGNQMFQYACAVDLERSHGFMCSLDDLSQLKYFQLTAGAHLKNTIKAKFFFHVAKRLKGMDIHNLQFDDMWTDYAEWLKNLNKPSMIWGFFQSERYFKDQAATIRRCFTVKPEYQEAAHNFFKRNNLSAGAYRAIHIRRTDYKGFQVKGLQGDDFTLPMSYYERAMAQLSKELPLVIISDDPSYCQDTYGHLEQVYISSEDAITDFQLLSNAAELVISNSTFAWWAAWLNPYAKNVFCPEYFLGFKENKEVPVNIYPEQWTKISVLEQ